MYKTNKGTDRLNKKELGYITFRKGINEYDTQQRELRVQQKGKRGKGYSGEKSKIFNASVEIAKQFPSKNFNGHFHHDFQTCPNNILSDISRLEVLIGGRGAGNNCRNN